MSTTAWRWVSDSMPEIRKTPDGDSGISSSTPANMLCILKSIMLSTQLWISEVQILGSMDEGPTGLQLSGEGSENKMWLANSISKTSRTSGACS